MRVNVDLEKSIERERLSAKNLDLTQQFNIGLYVFLAATFIAVGIIFPTLLLKQNDQVNTATKIASGVFYSIGLLTVYGIFYENKFVKIKGKTKELNKQVMLAVLKATYKTDLIYEGSDIFTYYKRATFWRFALRVIVLFNDDDVLINISRFNQRGLKSFFHPFFSRMKIKSLASEFETKLR